MERGDEKDHVPTRNLWGTFAVTFCAISTAMLCGISSASAQAWWISLQYGPPEVEDGRPVPSIASSLPDKGDPGGLRKWLGDRGIVYGVEYTNDLLSNVRGGNKTGTIDQGKIQGILTVDFGKLAGWDGLTMFSNFFQIHNTGRMRRDYVGGINTIEAIACRSVRLTAI